MVTQKSINIKNKKNIILTGGGTGGSVSPLLAIFDELAGGDYNFYWVGTKNGIEQEMVRREGIDFFSINSGKFRRYFSWKNFIDPFFVILGFFDSLLIIKKCNPDLVISAGGFVSVPFVWAARARRIPIIIHQQDARPGLANKLMCRCAKVITTVFKKSLEDFCKKPVWIGNPVRREFINLQKSRTRQESLKKFNLKDNKPVIFITGGGTGSVFLNMLVVTSLQELTKNFQILHATGKGREAESPLEWKYDLHREDYRKFEFLNTTQMMDAYNAADIVVSRCGMGALTELSFLKKVCILIPMPRTHQEDNARMFMDNEAAIVLNQKYLDSNKFIQSIKNLMENKHKQQKLRENIGKIIKQNASAEMVKIINKLITHNS